MSGPNTINPWGSVPVKKHLGGNGVTVIAAASALRGTNWAWVLTMLYAQINQFDGNLTIQTSDGVVLAGPYEGIVGNMQRAWDAFSNHGTTNLDLQAVVAGSTVCDIELEVAVHQEPVS